MTDREIHQRASALFLELRETPPGERQRVLGGVGIDQRLRREVLSLLENDSEAGSLPPDTPSRIGPYTIRGRIGRGGTGYVLLAEQHEPVRRRVAIKLVPHAAVSPDFAARFEFERRALERTEHPNIARILDTGRTADGLPYIVMELVDGPPITAFCRERGLGIRDRIALVIDVAGAVEHAHQRGVIHRDLKPGNILVGEAGGRPCPRVLDFGIAKPVGQDAGPAHTLGAPLGTPAYMPPEQTGGMPVDTRADVYALGAVLYELVCGRPPVDTSGDTVEVLKRIRDQVPARASVVRAQKPGAGAPGGAPRSLLADLDCVLDKALEKDPDRRYGSAAAFADDLRRVLAREPIVARPPTARYRAARFAQRNRALVASLAVISLAVALGIGGLCAGLIEAKRQQREATIQSEERREINRFLTDDLLAAGVPEQEGEHVTALDLLHRASRKVDERFADRPLVAASVHHTLGLAFSELGAYDDADRHLSRAVALRRAGAGVDAPDTVRSEIAAASLLARREKFAEAEAALRELIGRARLVLGDGDPALYAAMNDLGVVYEGMDRGADAVSLLQEALAGRSRLLGARDPAVLITMSNLAQGYDRLGKTDRSLELMTESLRIAESLPEPPKMTIIGLCNNIGATYQDLNRDSEAVPYLRRAADLASKWIGADNPDTLTIQGNLAGLEAKQGDPLKAAEIFDSIAKARAARTGEDAADTLTSRYGYWDALWHAKKFDEAAAGYLSLLPRIERSLGEKHWLATQTRASLARALLDGGHAPEAKPWAERAASEFLALYGPGHARTKTTTALVEEIGAKLRPAEQAGR